MASSDSRRCPTCIGSGEIFGGGFMMKDCPLCDGLGKIYDKPVDSVKPTQVVIDRRRKSYKESIAKIMASEDISRDDAVKIFDEEYAKI